MSNNMDLEMLDFSDIVVPIIPDILEMDPVEERQIKILQESIIVLEKLLPPVQQAEKILQKAALFTLRPNETLTFNEVKKTRTRVEWTRNEF